MAQAKKFGAFGGVFTPSILTILGVIMYLRLPWIAGQAGLFATIGIIIVAHIISVTTGLSVSSIATDKKVKAGGSYYILSRSLGLPIGGALGLALFVGLSFSVSLYLIGFSESFLSYWGFKVTKNTIRISGTIALLTVTTITFISTALALKTQYFILTAIILSLVSIFFGNTHLIPEAPVLEGLPNAVPWMVLFGIFFPAVTGFEAGVSMSGDLKDPKRTIPGGTIAAVSVGLVVYIGLTIFLTYRVDVENLANNPNVLLELSFFPPLVIAGIWGATLSSAMGSILGAPRILQAASSDKITHKFFAKGYGKENEPRNALLLTFVIAEAGILIGELDVIARIVSMFFITAYGFLNLSAALESWASPDFRPDFRVPRMISIFGAIACFLVMILLDFLAMVGATLAMGAIFLYLKRRELTLESGDTWEGVWSSLVRSGLTQLSKKQNRHQRNWRPNIILFSGGAASRPHLAELGKWLAFKRGVVSDFELIETEAQKKLEKSQQMVESQEENIDGIFTRRLEVDDIYDGIEIVCRIYGFSGIEPNTALLGWARHTKEPENFVRFLQSLDQLDYNTLLLDYDEERGFGNKSQIDVWWRGGNNNFTLILYLIRFLQASDEWQNAALRLMVINDDSGLTNTIYKNANRLFEEYRINAEVKVIQNGIERRAFDEIVRTESRNADLVILGMPFLNPDRANQFVKRFDSIIDDLGSLLMVSASSYFEDLHIGIEFSRPGVETQDKPEAEEITLLSLPEVSDKQLASTLDNLHAQFTKSLSDYQIHFVDQISENALQPVKQFERLTERIFDGFQKRNSAENFSKNRKLAARLRSDFLFQSRQLFDKMQQENIPQQAQILNQGLENLLVNFQEIIVSAPRRLTVEYDAAQFAAKKDDPLRLRFYKFRKSLAAKWTEKPFQEAIHFQDLLRHHLLTVFFEQLNDMLKSLAAATYQSLATIQKNVGNARDTFLRIEHRWQTSSPDSDKLRIEREAVSAKMRDLVHLNTENFKSHYQQMANGLQQSIIRLYEDAPLAGINLRIVSQYRDARKQEAVLGELAEAPEVWRENQQSFLNGLLLDLQLMNLQNRLQTIMEKSSNAIYLNIDSNLLKPLESSCKMLTALQDGDVAASEGDFRQYSNGKFRFDPGDILQKLRGEISEAVTALPETVRTFSETAFQHLENHPLETGEGQQISLRRLVAYMVEEDLVRPIQIHLADVPAQFELADRTATDILRLLAFHLEDSSDLSAEIPVDTEDIESMLRNANDRMLEQFGNVNQVYNELKTALDQYLKKILERLNSYTIAHAANNMDHYVLTHEGQKVLSGMGAAKIRVENFLREKLVRLLYRRSKEILAVRRFEEQAALEENPVQTFLSFREGVAPNPALLRRLPFYYQQLFLGEPAIHKDFWQGRKAELALAGKVVRQYQNGHNGALLVTGMRRSGKSALSRFIARQHLPKSDHFIVTPPAGGSTDYRIFKRHLENAMQTRGEMTEIFNGLSPNSVVIFNDLELWWERSPGGFELIEEIINLIEAFSDRCFFIVNISQPAFRLMKRIRPFESIFLAAIECSPFSAEELRHIILRRHRSTGFKMRLGGQPEDSISEWKRAKFFNRVFDFSQGNVGAALQSWLTAITEMKGSELHLSPPEIPIENWKDEIADDWQVLLIQLALHKQLTLERFAVIMDMEADDIRTHLQPLKRAALVHISNDDVVEIDMFMQPHLMRLFLEQGVV